MRWHPLSPSIITLTAALALCHASSGQVPKAQMKGGPAPVPEGVRAVRDLDYVGNGLTRQRLDLYLPEKADGPLPLVVWVHGGAWRTGSKDYCRALFLTTRGFAVASLNYRLIDAGPFPIQIEDCRAAIRWLRANASTYHLDPDRFGAWGGSAGGHLVALLGTAGDEKGWDGVGGNVGVSARVQAVCDFFGNTDFNDMIEADGDRVFPPDGPIARLLGGPPREKLDMARKASPVAYVSRDDPPFLIVHGDRDNTVPLRQSRLLHERLKEAGVDATLIVVKNGGHGTWGPDADPGTQAINDRVAAFFDEHLKAGKARSSDNGNGR